MKDAILIPRVSRIHRKGLLRRFRKSTLGRTAIAWVAVVLALGAVAMPDVWAADLYVSVVSPAGSDASNNCQTQASPCLTIGHAVSQAASGDIIHLAPGTYDTGSGQTFPISLESGVTIEGATGPLAGATGPTGPPGAVILTPGDTPAFVNTLPNSTSTFLSLTNATRLTNMAIEGNSGSTGPFVGLVTLGTANATVAPEIDHIYFSAGNVSAIWAGDFLFLTTPSGSTGGFTGSIHDNTFVNMTGVTLLAFEEDSGTINLSPLIANNTLTTAQTNFGHSFSILFDGAINAVAFENSNSTITLSPVIQGNNFNVGDLTGVQTFVLYSGDGELRIGAQVTGNNFVKTGGPSGDYDFFLSGLVNFETLFSAFATTDFSPTVSNNTMTISNSATAGIALAQSLNLSGTGAGWRGAASITGNAINVPRASKTTGILAAFFSQSAVSVNNFSVNISGNSVTGAGVGSGNGTNFFPPSGILVEANGFNSSAGSMSLTISNNSVSGTDATNTTPGLSASLDLSSSTKSPNFTLAADIAGNFLGNNTGLGMRVAGIKGATGGTSRILQVNVVQNEIIGNGNGTLLIAKNMKTPADSFVVSCNTITNNAGFGVSLSSDRGNNTGDLADLGGGPFSSPGDNSIHHNAGGNLINKSTTTAFAEDNWWGSASGPTGVSGDVTDTTFLTSAPGPIAATLVGSPSPTAGGGATISYTSTITGGTCGAASVIFTAPSPSGGGTIVPASVTTSQGSVTSSSATSFRVDLGPVDPGSNATVSWQVTAPAGPVTITSQGTAATVTGSSQTNTVSTQILTTTTNPGAGIPMLDRWGLLGLIALLCAGGWFMMRRSGAV